ncbi:MAG: J domain-containing protein [Sphingobacteriales bacterium]|nr:MAG: J domain-containing protein [Sphingobacteriales bacterium]
MAQKNYYSILGLPQTASAEDVKRAYRKLAFRYHPDQSKGGLQGEERFKEIKEAYEILIHPQQRRQHDATLRSQHI